MSPEEEAEHRKKTCPHCRFIATPSNVYWWENDRVVVQPFPKRYSLNMMPKEHIESDDSLHWLFIEGFNYSKMMGFKNPRFLINRAPKAYCNGRKEHLHLQICFDREPELFNQVFSKPDLQVVDGFLNRDLILEYAKSKIKKHGVMGSMLVETRPDEGDSVFKIHKEKIEEMFSDKSSFTTAINDGSISLDKGEFNPVLSEIYMFVNVMNDVVSKVLISYGSSSNVSQAV
jgi:hypothetical protein